MIDCKPYASLASTKFVLTPNAELPFVDPTLYRSLVGALQYITITRPDLTFSINLACQAMHRPLNKHFLGVKRLLKYLKGAIDQGLSFTASPLILSAFSDADWAGDSSDHRSTTGFCVYLGANLVSWCAKNQHIAARSSTEAEYMALAHAATELAWIQMVLSDLHCSTSYACVLWCDNISALALAANLVFHARTKHIEVDYHFVREKVVCKQLDVRHVSTIEQTADIFTKLLSVRRHLFLKDKLHVQQCPFSLREDSG